MIFSFAINKTACLSPDTFETRFALLRAIGLENRRTEERARRGQFDLSDGLRRPH